MGKAKKEAPAENLRYEKAIRDMEEEMELLRGRMYVMQKEVNALGGYTPERLKETIQNAIMKNAIAGVFSEDTRVQLAWQNHLLRVFGYNYKNAMNKMLNIFAENEALEKARKEKEDLEKRIMEQKADPNSPPMLRFRDHRIKQAEAAAKTGTE